MSILRWDFLHLPRGRSMWKVDPKINLSMQCFLGWTICNSPSYLSNWYTSSLAPYLRYQEHHATMINHFEDCKRPSLHLKWLSPTVIAGQYTFAQRQSPSGASTDAWMSSHAIDIPEAKSFVTCVNFTRPWQVARWQVRRRVPYVACGKARLLISISSSRTKAICGGWWACRVVRAVLD